MCIRDRPGALRDVGDEGFVDLEASELPPVRVACCAKKNVIYVCDFAG